MRSCRRRPLLARAVVIAVLAWVAAANVKQHGLASATASGTVSVTVRDQTPPSFPLCTAADRQRALAVLQPMPAPYTLLVRSGGAAACGLAGPAPRPDAETANMRLRAALPDVELTMFEHVPWVAARIDGPADVRAVLRAREATHVEVDAEMQLADTRGGVEPGTYWLEQMDVRRALAAGSDGRGTAVVVAGEPVDLQHPVFEGRQSVHAACFSEPDTVGTTMCPGNESRVIGIGAASRCDSVVWCNHGTAVASQIPLAAPGTELIPLVITVNRADGTPGTYLHLAVEAIDYAIGLKRDEGVDVRAFEYSYGNAVIEGDGLCRNYHRPLADAVGVLLDSGIAFVVAGGNGGGELYCPAGMVRGENPDGILAVAAVDGSDRLCDWSSSAPRAVGVSGEALWHAMPGGNVSTSSGTSLAAGLASALVADIGSAMPGITPVEVEALIIRTGRLSPVPPGSRGPDGYELPIPQLGYSVGMPQQPAHGWWSAFAPLTLARR